LIVRAGGKRCQRGWSGRGKKKEPHNSDGDCGAKKEINQSASGRPVRFTKLQSVPR